MAAGNGYDTSRLDRIEPAIESVVNVVADIHDEHRKLLAAQVVLTDRVDRLAQAQQHTDERLNTLVTIVDGIIRRQTPAQ
jgi:hypothetical protein